MGTRSPTVDPPRPPRWPRRLRDVGVVLLTLVLFEFGFRWLGPQFGIEPQRIERLRSFGTRRTGEFQPHPYTVLTLRRDRDDVNSLGFRDREWSPEPEPGVTRIACLGASTTYGFRVTAQQAFPRRLEELLRDQGHRVEVMNFGIPSWTSAETLMNYLLIVQDFRPDIAIIHHGISDLRPQTAPDFRMDYSHFRQPYREHRLHPLEQRLVAFSDLYVWLRGRHWMEGVQEGVDLNGPPPRGAGNPAAFRRNVLTVCEHVVLNGGRAVLLTMPSSGELAARWPDTVNAIQEQNEVLRELAGGAGVEMVDLERLWQETETRTWFTDLVHTTADGQEQKARALVNACLERDWLR